MAVTPFAFDPPTGWNDPTVFPTYESSEAKVRSDMQELHDQTRDYINNTVVPILNRNLLLVEIASFNSLPKTVNNVQITTDHVVLESTLGSPTSQTGDWTVTTANGSLTVSGTISGSTTLRLVLGIV